MNTSTGFISGTPSVPGTYNFTVQAMNASGCTGTQSYSLVIAFTITATGFGSCTGSRTYSGTISGGGCPTITLAALPSGTVGMAYTNYATASPAGTYSYAVTAGSLPPGLTLYVNGLVFGYPTAAGTYNFTITATDTSSCTGTRSYTVVIN